MNLKTLSLILIVLFFGIYLIGCDESDRRAPRLPPYNEPYVNIISVSSDLGHCDDCHVESKTPKTIWRNVTSDRSRCEDCHTLPVKRV